MNWTPERIGLLALAAWLLLGTAAYCFGRPDHSFMCGFGGLLSIWLAVQNDDDFTGGAV